MSESLAIVSVIVVMSVMYRRAGKKQMSLLALPLICVPCGRLLTAALLSEGHGFARPYSFVIEIAGLIMSVCLCTLLSRGLPSRVVRVIYLTLSFLFSGALVLSYLIRA